jgi:hypothetical protein
MTKWTKSSYLCPDTHLEVLYILGKLDYARHLNFINLLFDIWLQVTLYSTEAFAIYPFPEAQIQITESIS